MRTSSTASLADLAYTAGLVDGEGWIGIAKWSKEGYAGYTATLSVTMTDRPVLEWVSSVFPGGRFYVRPLSKLPLHKPTYRVTYTGRAAAQIVAQIFPYLKV